ncbi:MAG: ABC transporter permease [Pyrobaculum sp.]
MRLVQRESPAPHNYLIAAAGSLLTVMLIVLVATEDVYKAVNVFISLDLTNMARVFLVVAVIGLASVVSYRAGLWNIGQEGQAVAGALAALASQNSAEALALGLLAGAAWAAVPTALRVLLDVNEAVSTFLFTFVAIHVAQHFVEGPLRDLTRKGFIASVEAPHIDLAVAVTVTALFYGLAAAFFRTRHGLMLRLLASGKDVVKYAGASPKKYAATALALSGMLAGAGGALEIMSREAGRYMTLQQVSTGFGLYGISASWLGGLSIYGTLAASLYIAWLYQVGINLKIAGLPALVTNALVGAAMAWGLVGYVLYKYRVVWR